MLRVGRMGSAMLGVMMGSMIEGAVVTLGSRGVLRGTESWRNSGATNANANANANARAAAINGKGPGRKERHTEQVVKISRRR